MSRSLKIQIGKQGLYQLLDTIVTGHGTFTVITQGGRVDINPAINDPLTYRELYDRLKLRMEPNG